MTVKRIDKFEDFVRLEEDWNIFLFSSDLNSVFLTHQWFSTWWKHLSEDSELHVLIFRDLEERLLGLAPLRIKEGKLLFIAGHEVTDYCDFITCPKDREGFFRAFLKSLKEDYSNLTHFEFINIKETSPTLIHIRKLAPEYGFACSQMESEVVPVLDLPTSYDAYTSGLERKNRHELRRKLRRIESLEGLKTKKITEPDELTATVDAFIDLHRASSEEKMNFWQKEGMIDFFREIVHQFAFRGWAELNCMFMKDSLVAALLNFTYQHEILFYNVAYSADFAAFSPGFYLFNSSIHEAIAAKKTRVDFLRGREKYKYDFGSKECRIYSLILTPGESLT
ncbi:GNAT family N-acetyltransferase [Acidobacteriota bacterium]